MLVLPGETCLQHMDSECSTQSLRPSSAALFCAPQRGPWFPHALRAPCQAQVPTAAAHNSTDPVL